MDNEKLENNVDEVNEFDSVSTILNLSKADIKKIMINEFGESITKSKGFDNLLKTLIN